MRKYIDREREREFYTSLNSTPRYYLSSDKFGHVIVYDNDKCQAVRVCETKEEAQRQLDILLKG